MPRAVSAWPMLEPSRPAPTMRTVPCTRDARVDSAARARAAPRARRCRGIGHCVSWSLPAGCGSSSRSSCDGPLVAWRASVSSAPRSTLVNSRVRPAGRVPRWSGPNERRTSSTTGCPTSAIMRRTMRLRPECRVSSTSELPPSSELDSSRALSAAIGPSSSSIPRVSLAIVCARHAAVDLRDVDLRHAERRVREHVGEFAVVGEDEQTAGLGIQSADVVEALRPVLREAPQVGAAAIVVHRAHDAGRLVEHDVALRRDRAGSPCRRRRRCRLPGRSASRVR